jgi:hypothetical protein
MTRFRNSGGRMHRSGFRHRSGCFFLPGDRAACTAVKAHENLNHLRWEILLRTLGNVHRDAIQRLGDAPGHTG